jgi:two-component system NarL family sensor kinase
MALPKHNERKGEPGAKSPERLLGGVAEALAVIPDMRAALERTLALVAEGLGLQAGWVWLLDPDTGQFYSSAVHNLPPYLREPVRMAGSAPCWCMEAFLGGRLGARNVSILNCSRLTAAATPEDRAATLGLRAHASIPLRIGDKPLGILNVTAPGERELTRNELGLLSTVAHQVAVAVERARLSEETAGRARNEERARLAREIHDTLVQDLAGIALQIESALGAQASDPGLARRRLERALALTRDSLAEARRSVVNLRPSALEGRSLPEALRGLARRLTAESGIRATVIVGPSDEVADRLPPRVEGELFRIAQEALANVRRHSVRATDAAVSLRIEAKTVTLVVTDNGQTAVPTAGGSDARDGGQGIPGMRERAHAIGGTLRLRTSPRGVRLVVRAPLPPEPAGQRR